MKVKRKVVERGRKLRSLAARGSVKFVAFGSKTHLDELEVRLLRALNEAAAKVFVVWTERFKGRTRVDHAEAELRPAEERR